MTRLRIVEFNAEKHIKQIDEIWKRCHSDAFSVPNRRNRVIDAVVESEDGKVAAYGQVKLMAEAMFIVDSELTTTAKTLALVLLMQRAFQGINKARLDQMYAFIRDPDFSLLIQKHFGFHSIIEPGELLIWEE
jgi:hypothetical protein